MVDFQVPSKTAKEVHETHTILMEPAGEAAKPQPGDL